MKKKLILIPIGPPGAGKGTIAFLLAESFSLYLFETSKILEERFTNFSPEEFVEVEGKKYFIKDEFELFKSGKLASPPFVTHLVQEKIKEIAKLGLGIVFTGSPRTLYEAQRIMPLLSDLYGKDNIFVFLLEITEEESIFRNSHRRICKLLRHPILYLKETENLSLCPLDGSPLEKRIIDKPEIIKVRFKEYLERTLPILDYFKEQKYKLFNIPAKNPPYQVFKDIISKIDDYLKNFS